MTNPLPDEAAAGDAAAGPRPAAGWLGLAGALVIAAGTLLAWVEVGFLGETSSASGIDTNDGKVVAGAGVLAALLAVGALASRAAAWLYLAIPVAVLVLAVTAYDIADIESMASDLSAGEDAVFTVDSGIGIWLSLAGAVAVVLAGVWAFVDGRRRRRA